MSIVCAVKKNDEIAISADSLLSFGSTLASSRHLKNSDKLYRVNGSVIGIVGWNAVIGIVEHLILHDKKLFRLGSRMEILSTLLALHERMKHDYYLETVENRDQPVESTQLLALVANRNGLFEINSYREVNEYRVFWAMGSGKRLALGAMHALYDQQTSAKAIAEAGVRAACEFDDACGLPLKSRVICDRGLEAVVA
jgi:ATP-dependent protease HslVU (ClpYQ) peptidase subunit